jgi:hypothetical protein
MPSAGGNSVVGIMPSCGKGLPVQHTKEFSRRQRRDALIAAILVIVFLLGWLYYPLLVRAESSHRGMHGSSPEIRGYHNEHHHDRLHHWYQKLMRPDVPHMSCCNRQDCTPTQAKLVDGKWRALKAGRWITIPNEKINSEESVDSQAHICWYPSTIATDDVLCFVKPGNGI